MHLKLVLETRKLLSLADGVAKGVICKGFQKSQVKAILTPKRAMFIWKDIKYMKIHESIMIL